MKMHVFGGLMAATMIAASSVVNIAQSVGTTSEKFVISARAGAVNVVFGDVTVERSNGRTGRLFKGDELQTGEKVATGADGKVEILMNPGSYIRLGANSSFEFDSTDLDDVRVKVHSGSAVFEVFGAEEFTVDVKAGRSRFAFVDTGIYRVDIDAVGESTVSIVKGKVLPGLDITKAVKSGRKLEYKGTAFAVAKFDRDQRDELARWSDERAKELSRISSSLKPDRLRDPLINSFFGNQWNLYNSFGVWVYDPFFRSFCFLPFGYGWRSPYGYGFGRPIWYYNLPGYIFRSVPPQVTVSTPPGNTKTDRGFADVVKRGEPGSPRKVGDYGEIRTIGGPRRAPLEPRVELPVKSPPISASEPSVSIPTKSPGKQP